MRKLTGVVLALIVVIAGIAFATYRWATNEYTAAGPLQETARIEVPAGPDGQVAQRPVAVDA